MSDVTRRNFLKGVVLTGGGLLIGGEVLRYLGMGQARTLAQIPNLTPHGYLPFVAKNMHSPTPTVTPTLTQTPTSTATATATSTQTATPTATPTSPGAMPKVVHAHSASATNWDFGNDWYGNHVNQDAINRMTDEGLMRLTDTASRAAAWGVLLPNYQHGQVVAIKINLNNCLSDGCSGNAIDALIEPINALIAGLVEHSVAIDDIWVYDATHAWHDGRMPPRLVNGCDYSGVHFAAYVGQTNPFSTTAKVHFNTPGGGPPLGDQPLCNVLANAHYLINLPIVKSHPFTGVSLGFKNHFGSFDRCDYAHAYTPGCPANLYACYYSSNYSPLIDIYSNPHVRDKTILTIGDCLFGAWSDPTWKPQPWKTFNNGAPNSLFFARDPVAVECVMTDILAAETTLLAKTDDYLRLAGAAGLGVYERGDPWRDSYQKIDYMRIDLA